MKEKINHEQRLLSMFEFRMIMEMMYANENRIQGQNELLSSIGVDTSFSSDFTNEIREKWKR